MNCLSPIDGRYAAQVDDLRELGFTERQLILTKARIELDWLIFLSDLISSADENLELTPAAKEVLWKLRQSVDTHSDFQDRLIKQVQEVEQRVQHDTKAVELTLREIIGAIPELAPLQELTHIGLTSEDVTNTAYAVMFGNVYARAMRPMAVNVAKALAAFSRDTRSSPLLGMTHGQVATPSTMGKELAVFLYRLSIAQFAADFGSLAGVQPRIKFGGAVGTHAALRAAYPSIDWRIELARFVESQGPFQLDICTTQVASVEWQISKLRAIQTQNNVLLDLVRDLWLYTSRGLLKQAVKSAEVGSSTMPHKVNPIYFENAEGNLVIANGLLDTICQKLSQSRLQRDLSNSTVTRNIGLALAHTFLSYKVIEKGLKRVSFDPAAALSEIDAHLEILAEPVQTILRKYPKVLSNPYEVLKSLTRTNSPAESREALTELVMSLQNRISETDFNYLTHLLKHPAEYIGYAPQITDQTLEIWNQIFQAADAAL